MKTLRVNCLGKSFGIGKGLRFELLEGGESVGNTFCVDEIIDTTDIKVYSEMLGKVVGIFNIQQFVEMIESGEIVVL